MLILNSAPRFGCRLLGYASATPHLPLLDKMFNGTDSRSFASQSKTMFPEEGLQNIWTMERLIPKVSDWINKDGIGAIAYDKNKACAVANHHAGPATEVLGKGSTWLKLPKVFSNVLGHIRAVTAGVVSLANTQPFHLGKLIFQHNGDLGDQLFSPAFRQRIKQNLPEFKLGDKPSDSKLLFAALASELRLRYGTIDPSKISAQDIQQTFYDICHYGTSQNPLDIVGLDPKVTNIPIHGEMDWSGASNFILSTGNDMYAYRKHLSLWVATIQNEQGDVLHTMIQSEPTQNLEEVSPIPGQKIKWTEVPNNHVLHVHTKPDGKQYLELTPFARLAQSSKPLQLTSQKLQQSA
jgi:predicted glutamine amidotransferase